jgi:AGCS family alanine or glycine:cation symporter
MKKYLLSIFALNLPVLIFAQETTEVGLDEKIDQAFQPVSDFFSNVILFEIFPGVP